MPTQKKRNKNGTWSPIYGPAWVHPKTRAAADRVAQARPRLSVRAVAPFLVLGWLNRLNVWLLGNDTSGRTAGLSDVFLATVAWPEAIEDGAPPAKLGALIRGALRAGGFLENGPDGERVHQFREFHGRILSDRERHGADDDAPPTPPSPGEPSPDGATEDSAEGSADHSAEHSADGSADPSAARGEESRGDKNKTPRSPPKPGGRRGRGPDRVVSALHARLGCNRPKAAEQIRALRADGWTDQRILDAIEAHGRPTMQPWDWARLAVGTVRGTAPAPLTKPDGTLTPAGILAAGRELDAAARRDDAPLLPKPGAA